MGLRSPRSQQLQALAANAPNQQREQLNQAQAAQTMQIQQAFGAGSRQPGQTPTAGQIQQIGAQRTQAAGQAALQIQQQAGEEQAGRGQELLRLKQQQNKQALQLRGERLVRTEQELQNRLYSVNRRLGKELWSAQLRFEKDELGRTMFNERQLADWKLSKARTMEDLANYEQQVRQASQKRMAILEAAEKKLRQELEQQWTLDETRRDQEFTIRLQKAVHALRMKREREMAAAASRAARNSAIGGIIGGVVVGGAAMILSGGTAAPMLPALVAGGSKIGSGVVTASS